MEILYNPFLQEYKTIHGVHPFDKIKVEHYKPAFEEGMRRQNDEIERIPRYFYAYRNDFATARRRGIRDVAVYLAAFGLNLCRILLHSPDHKRERIGIMWKGFAAGLRFSPEISFAAEPKRADGEDI